MIAPEHLDFKGPTRSHKHYCVVGQLLNWRDGNNVYVLISRDINDDFMVLIKGFEQDPDLGVKIVHLSLDNYIEATDSDKKENNDENTPETQYDGENMDTFSDYERNND